MKEYQEETNNKDEDNEKLNPVKFESFNISLPEQEIPLPKQNTKRNLYLLIILVIIIIIIIICFLASSEKEITCPKGYFIPNDANDKSKCMKCSVENCEVCSGEILSNTCTSCKQYLTPIFENEKIWTINFILHTIFALLGCFIFCEVITLNFCNLDKNTFDKTSMRSKIEINSLVNDSALEIV